MTTPEQQPDEPPKPSLTLAELFCWLTGKEATPEEMKGLRETCERINARLNGGDQQPPAE
jgi:hypothetical protein